MDGGRLAQQIWDRVLRYVLEMEVHDATLAKIEIGRQAERFCSYQEGLQNFSISCGLCTSDYSVVTIQVIVHTHPVRTLSRMYTPPLVPPLRAECNFALTGRRYRNLLPPAIKILMIHALEKVYKALDEYYSRHGLYLQPLSDPVDLVANYVQSPNFDPNFTVDITPSEYQRGLIIRFLLPNTLSQRVQECASRLESFLYESTCQGIAFTLDRSPIDMALGYVRSRQYSPHYGFDIVDGRVHILSRPAPIEDFSNSMWSPSQYEMTPHDHNARRHRQLEMVERRVEEAIYRYHQETGLTPTVDVPAVARSYLNSEFFCEQFTVRYTRNGFQFLPMPQLERLNTNLHWSRPDSDPLSLLREARARLERPPTPKHIGDLSCAYNAKSQHLRCTVNPSGPCEGCKDYEKVTEQ